LLAHRQSRGLLALGLEFTEGRIMTMQQTFETIRAKPNGPIKKFELLKLFGKTLKANGIEDPRALSCAEIEGEIAILLGTNGAGS
jgi:hypothetical protein